MKDLLGSRMKEYEQVTKTYLPRMTPVIIRIDGRAFHTYTRKLKKPFDDNFVKIMQNVCLKLCQNIQNCVLGYVQSDEISLLLVDYYDINTSAWFNNQVQKMVSVSASMATLYFNEEINKLHKEKSVENYEYFKENLATFDSRVFALPLHEVVNYFIWRQKDASRNSVNVVAQSFFNAKELEGISNSELLIT